MDRVAEAIPEEERLVDMDPLPPTVCVTCGRSELADPSSATTRLRSVS